MSDQFHPTEREDVGSTEQALRDHLHSEAARWGADNEDKLTSYAFLDVLLQLIRSRLFAFILFIGIVFLGVLWLLLLSRSGWSSNYLPLPLYGVTSLLALLTLVVGVRWFDEYATTRGKGNSGSVLQVHFALLFSVFTAVPIVIVSIFSLVFFEMGVDRWFSGIVERAVDSSAEVARAYQEDRKNRIGVSVLEMARKIESQGLKSEEEIAEVLSLGKFDEGIVFTLSPLSGKEVIARHGVTFLLENESINEEALKNAKEGEPVILFNLDEKRVQALVKLNDPRQLFLYGVDYLSESAADFTQKAQEAALSYSELNATKGGVKVTLLLGFGLFALLLVLSSLWLGLNFARWLVSPISKLLAATDMVSNGNLSVHVRDDKHSLRELRNLTHSFNHMTKRLYNQQQALVKSNGELEDRQYLLEEVLRGVSAGVVGVDMSGKVCLMNARADALCSGRLQVDAPVSELGGEIAGFILSVLNRLHFERVEDVNEREVEIESGFSKKVLRVRIFPSKLADNKKPFMGEVAMVVTIDDITGLLSAQRQAAWSDVARRIAHEIKNPLTPIQLSAERLQKRYAALVSVEKDRGTFERCISTIITQVENIRSMVDEFAHFSRMPRAVLKREPLAMIIRQSLFLQSHSDERNCYELLFDGEEGVDDRVMADKHLLSQVLTNLLLNGRDAIEKRRQHTSEENYEGRITVQVDNSKHWVRMVVEDNGCGWDVAASGGNLQRFLEPYVTSGTKGGTGLGLSIVRRVMEQHGGSVRLEPGKEEGARVVLTFPKVQAKEEATHENQQNSLQQ